MNSINPSAFASLTKGIPSLVFSLLRVGEHDRRFISLRKREHKYISALKRNRKDFEKMWKV